MTRIDIRKSYQNSDIPRIKAGKLEAFFHEKKRTNGATKLILTVFKGKALKPFYNYYIPGSWERRQKKWDEIRRSHLLELDAERKEKEAVAKLRKLWRNPYKTGDILYTSWGYEQTNIDFYQAVKVNRKSLVLKPIGCLIESRDHMTGCKTPAMGDFQGGEFTARITFRNFTDSDGEIIHSVINKRICAHSGFNFWHGNPVSYSNYH